MARHDCGLCRVALEDVSVEIGGQSILEHVSMHIHCGELTALVGPNGAGKTTLVRALLAQAPHSGSIRHMDAEERDFPGLRTGYVPQQLPFDLQMPLSVRDLLAAALTRRPVWLGISKKTRARVAEALAVASAEELADRRLGALSGGELQRVLLALALMPTPDLLIMDEPVSGMDQNGLAQFLATVRALRETHHIAMLLVSHDFDLVRRYADSVILLDKTVLAAGAPEDVFASDAFRQAFPDKREARA